MKYQINHKHINLMNVLPLGNQFEKLWQLWNRETEREKGKQGRAQLQESQNTKIQCRPMINANDLQIYLGSWIKVMVIITLWLMALLATLLIRNVLSISKSGITTIIKNLISEFLVFDLEYTLIFHFSIYLQFRYYQILVI